MKIVSRLLKFGILIVLLIAGALGVVWWKIDSLAKSGIELGTNYALGVDTKVEDVSVSLLRGRLTVSNLTVANPVGYEQPHLFRSGLFDVRASLPSFFSDTVRIESIDLDGLDVFIERKQKKTNISVIGEHLKKRTGGGADAPADDAPAGKSLNVGRVAIRNIVAHVQLLPIGGKASVVDVRVPELVFENLTPEGGGAVAVHELVRRLVPAVLAAILKSGEGVVPADLLDSLRGDLASVTEQLGEEAGKLIQQVTDDKLGPLLKGVDGNLKEGIEGAGKKVEDEIKKGLEGLLNRKKE
ncbi:MAG: hypothetical protein OER86_00510 [Phycisphaerae bacterium]|nr:hypothetical protein [Phycisphaerae bacterium]